MITIRNTWIITNNDGSVVQSSTWWPWGLGSSSKRNAFISANLMKKLGVGRERKAISVSAWSDLSIIPLFSQPYITLLQKFIIYTPSSSSSAAELLFSCITTGTGASHSCQWLAFWSNISSGVSKTTATIPDAGSSSLLYARAGLVFGGRILHLAYLS